MSENIYEQVQAVLLNSEGDPRHVVSEAMRALLEFADGEGVRVLPDNVLTKDEWAALEEILKNPSVPQWLVDAVKGT